MAMQANLQRRIDLAEIRHIRYGLLNANLWAERLAPIFSKKIAAFDLTPGDKDALRPSIERMVNRMIVQSGEICIRPEPDSTLTISSANQKNVWTVFRIVRLPIG